MSGFYGPREGKEAYDKCMKDGAAFEYWQWEREFDRVIQSLERFEDRILIRDNGSLDEMIEEEVNVHDALIAKFEYALRRKEEKRDLTK